MNAYEIITARILEQLEQGTVPWQKPWNAQAGMPRNLLSQKPYRGINVWMLTSAGYASPYWLTFKQARDIGGYVKKGEHGYPIVLWQWLDKGEQQEGEEETSYTTQHRVPFARLYTVFNAQQCELPERLQRLLKNGHTEEADSEKHIDACEQIVAAMPHRPMIQHGEARAYYRPFTDTVNMPARHLFPKTEHYYSVLFHELTHSTGHGSRLDRPTLKDMLNFGDTNYSKEELVAEMGAAYLCGVAGIGNETVENSAAYIHGWLGKLRNDKKLLIHAAAQAQRAADYILDHTERE